MSSESNGSKPDLPEEPPTSGGGRRQSARAPSAWGAARDALAAVRNLEVLLRSGSVSHKTILDLLPELRSGGDVLRQAFAGALGGDWAASPVGRYGEDRVNGLAGLFDAAVDARANRGELASRARELADELEASADLVALLERASAPVPTEVSVGLIVRETSRMSGRAGGRELGVRFDEGSTDAVVTTDPYVVGPLLLLAVGWASAAALDDIVIRAHWEPPNAVVLVEGAGPSDSTLPVIAMHVLPAVPPAEDAVQHVAACIGARFELEPNRWRIVLPPAPKL